MGAQKSDALYAGTLYRQFRETMDSADNPTDVCLDTLHVPGAHFQNE